MATISETFALAHQYHQSGALPQAEYLYNQVLQADPSHVDAWCFLASACQGQGKVVEAEAAYRKTLQLRPTYVEAHNNLGNTLMSLGRLDEAIAAFKEAIRQRPDFALVHNNLALAYERQHRLDEATSCWAEAIRLQPGFPEAHCNLGNALQTRGMLDEAIEHYRTALRGRPTYPECLNNLGNALRNQWKLNEALDCYRQALQLNPNFPEALCNMGAALEPQGRLDDAIQCYRQALSLRPNYAEAHNNMGVALMSQGRFDQAAGYFQQAIRLQPNLLSTHSSYLLCVNYDPQADQETVFKEHCRWGRLHTPTSGPDAIIRHENDTNPDRKLRIGYVSPDLRFHALTRYLEPVLAHHDPAKVEVYCYAEVVNPDAVSLRLQKYAHGWRVTCGQSDAQVAEMIRRDRIDILVDLAGHTAGTRLTVFGLKPAPIQVSWLGYLNTTGLTTIDYRLTDTFLDPPNKPARGTEELFRIPGGFCCFGPPMDSPDVGQLPAFRNGFITFGSLHNLFKLNSQVLDLWSRVLQAIPTSRLLMFRDSLAGTARERMQREFVQRGIAAERLDLRRAEDARNYLSIYHEIDVCLDAFPWSGGVTSCESLWMGVPILSLRGDRPAGRNSSALLSRVGLNDWAFDAPDEFVAFAETLPRRLEELAQLRGNLRDRMTATICNGEHFTRELEGVYRAMWRKWCAAPNKPLPVPPPDHSHEAEQANDRGVQFAQQGLLEEAKAQFQKAVELQPDYVNPRVNLGLTLVHQHKFDEAVTQYQEVLQLRPDHAEAHYHLGFAFQQLGKLEEASGSYRQAVRCEPNHREAHNNLGVALRNQGRLEEAEQNYRIALKLKPDHIEARNNLGIALMDQGRLEEAVESYRIALNFKPDHIDCQVNLGIALMDQGHLDDAAACFRQALRLNPNLADAHSNLGVTLTSQGKLDEALAHYEQALHRDPQHADAHHNRAIVWLLRGHWAAAWPEYEWRWHTKVFPRLKFDQPRWDGRPLAGQTILLVAEQGLGDTLHFMRYVPMVQERGGNVIVRCQPPLQKLLAACFGADRVVASTAPLPKFDVFAPLMSIPGIFGTTPANVPANVPYLSADPQLVKQWHDELASLTGFKIGIAWHGSPKNRMNRLRSFPLTSFAPIAKVPGVQLISLQKGPGADQLQALAGQFSVLDLESRLDESKGPFMDSAAVMMNLDLVISADTAVAHLAGALGVPVWTALPFVSDWRWLLQRDDTPWYPTMRLFRQKRSGEWHDVFEHMASRVARGEVTRRQGDMEKRRQGDRE